MKAIVFAAGKGERMRPLTDHTPKPLLKVNGKPLLDYHLDKLAQAGFTHVMINLAHLGSQIRAYCGTGERYGLLLSYSDEGPEPLETGGALDHCLPWFAGQAFAMVSADIYSDCSYSVLAEGVQRLQGSELMAELVLTNNPEHHPKGDFGINRGLINRSAEPRFTYSGLGCAKPALIARFPGRRQRFPLRDALTYWLDLDQVGAQLFTGHWTDVGTPERLASLQST